MPSLVCPAPGAILVIVALGFLDTELVILPEILEEVGAVYVTSPLNFNPSEFELMAFI